MSKNFEREYREYLNAQAPDLWDRIESGIEADGVAVLPESTAKSKTKSNRKKRARYYRLIASVAACVTALCLIVPVYRLVNHADTNEKNMAVAEEMVLTDATIENTVESGGETAPAGDSIPQPLANTEMPAEVAEFTEESATEEVAAQAEAESVVTEPRQIADSKAGTGMGTDGNGENASQDMDSGNTENFGLASLESEEDLNAPSASLKISVLAETEQLETGIVYEVTVVESADPSINTNDRLQIVLPAEGAVILEKNVTYAVTLQKQADTAYYTVVSAEAIE